MSHGGYKNITVHFIFFFHPTSLKWFVSWTVGNKLLKPFCSKMLDWLNFRLGEIIGLIHVLEKRYYQNKTQLHYNFDSVYLGSEQQRCWSDCTDALADMRLCCSHMASTGFLMTWLNSTKLWFRTCVSLVLKTCEACSTLIFLHNY